MTHPHNLAKHNVFFIVPLHRSWAIKTSSRQRELDAQAEILRGRRITAARQERRIGLAIIVETHGKHLAQGIISRETQLQGIVAAAGAARHRRCLLVVPSGHQHSLHGLLGFRLHRYPAAAVPRFLDALQAVQDGHQGSDEERG